MPVTAAQLAAYLRPVDDATRQRGVRPPPKVLEVLAYGEGRDHVYVRWPSGQVRWEQAESLRTRGFTLPATGVLERETRSA